MKVSQVSEAKKPFSLYKMNKKKPKKYFIYKINNFFKIYLWNNNMVFETVLR